MLQGQAIPRLEKDVAARSQELNEERDMRLAAERKVDIINSRATAEINAARLVLEGASLFADAGARAGGTAVPPGSDIASQDAWVGDERGDNCNRAYRRTPYTTLTLPGHRTCLHHLTRKHPPDALWRARAYNISRIKRH